MKSTLVTVNRLSCQVAFSVTLGVLLYGIGPASAQDAEKILRSMAAYVGAQENISFDFDSSIEVTSATNQRIQYDSSGRLQLMRPDKLRVSRTGGRSDVEFVSDGKTATLLGKRLNAYMQVNVEQPTLAGLIEHLKVDLPMAAKEVFHPNGITAILANVKEAKVVGQGVINGIKCDQIAFRGEKYDWQLWVQPGDRPVPCKYVITSTAAGAPQYSLTIKNWKTDATADASAFNFVPPSGAKKVVAKNLPALDEVPGDD